MTLNAMVIIEKHPDGSVGDSRCINKIVQSAIPITKIMSSNYSKKRPVFDWFPRKNKKFAWTRSKWIPSIEAASIELSAWPSASMRIEK